jgi:hypothetical protein
MFLIQRFFNKSNTHQIGDTRVKKAFVIVLTINHQPRVFEVCSWRERLTPPNEYSKHIHWRPVEWLN